MSGVYRYFVCLFVFLSLLCFIIFNILKKRIILVLKQANEICNNREGQVL